MDDRKRKDFHRLLVDLDAERDRERESERRRALETNRAGYRFEEVAREVLVPTLREFMADLERRGHMTRLTRNPSERVRLDVQLQARVPKRCVIEFSVKGVDPGQVRVRSGWSLRELDQETLPMERLDTDLVADRVLRLLKGV